MASLDENDLNLIIKDLRDFPNFFSTPIRSDFQFLGDVNIVHLNIRSMRQNFDEFIAVFDKSLFTFDIIVMSEIWIDSFETGLYNLHGYRLYSNCRPNNRSGGIIIYVKENLDFSLSNCDTISSAEYLCMYSKRLDLYILACYRSHSFTPSFFITELNTLLKNCKSKNIVLIGDLNIDILKNDPDSNVYMDFMYDKGFKSCLNIPTRITEKSESCIDHIFIRTKTFLVKTGCLLNSLTDHYPIVCKLSTAKSINFEENNVLNSKYCIDHGKFEALVSSVDFKNSLGCIDDYVSFENLVLDVFKNSTHNVSYPKTKKKEKWLDNNTDCEFDK